MSKYDFDWHGEYYRKALRDMAKHASETCGDCSGWIEWFRSTYPEQHGKFEAAIRRINELWGNMEPRAMEDFKAAVKIESDATRWAIEKYIQCGVSPVSRAGEERQTSGSVGSGAAPGPCELVIEVTETKK